MEIKWIKLDSNIFNNRKIQQIECLPEGDTLLIIWLKLLVLAGTINDGGLIYLTREIAYTDDMLANAFGKPLQVVKMALGVFERFEMIEIIDNIIQISNWEKYQNIEGMEKVREQNRKRKQLQREREHQKLLEEIVKDDDETMSRDLSRDVTQENKNKNKNKNNNKEIIKESNDEILELGKTKHTYGQYKNVKLTITEYGNLQSEFGNVEELIKCLDEAKEMKGYKYKSDYLAIKKWVVDEVAKRKAKPVNKGFSKDEMNVADVDVKSIRDRLFNDTNT